ncbi:MAG: serine/threonine protein kinase [Myxococcales bacterium]|nr:serine/threonine protein kinase [Myxococcales bacterium]
MSKSHPNHQVQTHPNHQVQTHPNHTASPESTPEQNFPKREYYWDASATSFDGLDEAEHSLSFPYTLDYQEQSQEATPSGTQWPSAHQSSFDWPQATASSENWDGYVDSQDQWQQNQAPSIELQQTLMQEPADSQAEHPLYPHLASVFEAYQAYRNLTVPRVSAYVEASPSATQDTSLERTKPRKVATDTLDQVDTDALETPRVHVAVVAPLEETPSYQHLTSPVSPPSPVPQSSKTIIADRYEVLQMLGQGNYGSVYKVRDNELDDIIALKVLHPEACEDEEQIARFRREALLSRRVTHHNIARVYDIGRHNNSYYMTMEYIDGLTLAAWSKKKAHFTLQEVLDIMIQLCAGLEAAHRLGIIHRDLKPENIMVTHDERIVITDFGIARQNNDKRVFKTCSGDVLATPAYMSPEQIKRHPHLDHKTDIYTLGIIMFELLCQTPPTPGDSVQAILVKRLTTPPLNPCSLRKDIPASLGLLNQQCMALEPIERPEDIKSFHAALLQEQEAPRQKKKKKRFFFFAK